MNKRPTLAQLLNYGEKHGLASLCKFLSDHNLMQELMTEKEVKDLLRERLDTDTINQLDNYTDTIELLLSGGSDTGWYWKDTSLQGASCFGETYPINELQDLYLENDFYDEDETEDELAEIGFAYDLCSYDEYLSVCELEDIEPLSKQEIIKKYKGE